MVARSSMESARRRIRGRLLISSSYTFLFIFSVETTPIDGMSLQQLNTVSSEIIRRENEAGETASSLSSRFIDEFLHDMVELQCLPPTRELRVTEHRKQIIDLIAKVELIKLW